MHRNDALEELRIFVKENCPEIRWNGPLDTKFEPFDSLSRNNIAASGCSKRTNLQKWVAGLFDV